MSGIYIPGVERPRCCMFCHYHKSLRAQCILAHRDQRDLWSRPDWCPIIPVPPHGRLIDADALCNRLLTAWDTADKEKKTLISAVMADVVTPIVVGTPTIIPTEGSD